jgi:hypothetical protein
MKGRWPFSRKTTHDSEASGLASRGRDRRRMPPPRQLRPSPACVSATVGSTASTAALARPRVYVLVKLARQLFADREPVPRPDVNLPARWHLNSRRVPVLPVPRDGPERRREIHRRQAHLPMHLRRDPAFDIESLNWDTFSMSGETGAPRHARQLPRQRRLGPQLGARRVLQR